MSSCSTSTVNPVTADDPSVIIQGFLQVQNQFKWKNCFCILRYNKVKNCSSLSCYLSDKITPQDVPCHIIDIYNVISIMTSQKYMIEIVSATNAGNDSLILQCPDRSQLCQWLAHLEHVRSLSLFTCEKSDLQYSNISGDMLFSLKNLYSSVVQSLKREFKKNKTLVSNARPNGNQISRLVLTEQETLSTKMVKQYGSVRVAIHPSNRYDFLNRFEERNTSWWNDFREKYQNCVVFSDREIPRSPADEQILKSEFNLGDPIYGRAYWPHALRNYALGKLHSAHTMKRKGKENYNMIYGPAFRTVHTLFILLFMKIDGVYQIGEKDEINQQFKCWSYANFGRYGSIQSDNDYLDKIDFWAFNQTIKIPIFSFESSPNPDSWEIASQNFVKLSLQLPLGKSYEIEFELRFLLRNPSTNTQIEPLFDTKLSAPISTGKFILHVPYPDDLSIDNRKQVDDWIPRLPKSETFTCDNCASRLEEMILEFLNREWVINVRNQASIPLHLCITGPKILLTTQEQAIPISVSVYQDPRNGWKSESVVMLKCSIIYKVQNSRDYDKPLLSSRRRQNTSLALEKESKSWKCEYCESGLPNAFQSYVIHENRKINLPSVPEHIWKNRRCPEHLRDRKSVV